MGLLYYAGSYYPPLHEGILDSNPVSDHLSHVDCEGGRGRREGEGRKGGKEGGEGRECKPEYGTRRGKEDVLKMSTILRNIGLLCNLS